MSSEKKKKKKQTFSQQATNCDPKDEKNDKKSKGPKPTEWRRNPSMWDSATLISKLYCL